MTKVSVRFYGESEVRALWDGENSKWWFSAVDVVGALNGEENHRKNRNYWKYLKGKLRREGNELVSATNQFRLVAPDGKRRLTDMLDDKGVLKLVTCFPNTKAMRFAAWFTGGEDSIDSRSKARAYALFGSGIIDSIEVGTANGLKQIHAYLFGGLYDFAGKIRDVNIAKGGFQFAMAQFLPQTLKSMEEMTEESFDEIVDKYVEMNVAHPFREGNGRSARIWLDMMLKKRLGKCVDWSLVGKYEYLLAMRRSVSDPSEVKTLLFAALTDRVDDRETFMKGIDYSYYYEEEE